MVELPIPDTECVVEDPTGTPLARGVAVGPSVSVDGDAIEVCFSHVGAYRLEDGRRVTVRPAPGVSSALLSFYLRATPFGLLVLQRGELPLHASAVVPPGGEEALLIAGDSGAGKSTTAALLARAGWSILNDDISRVTLEGDAAVAHPGFQTLKLGDASVELLQLGDAGLPRTPGGKDKVFWQASVSPLPKPVRGMLILDAPYEAYRPPRRLEGMDLLQGLYRQTFRPHLVKPLGLHEAHFRNLVSFARSVPVFALEGNHSLPAAELVAALERLVEEPL